MLHSDALVKLLDEQGQVIGSKPRREVDKLRDILHCADALVIQEGKIVLAKLPANTLYGGTWGTTTATMVREQETPAEAIARALERELGITGAHPELLGEKFYRYDDGVKRLKTAYFLRWDGELHPNPEDIAELAAVTREALEHDMAETPANFAPTFLQLYETYKDRM